MDSEGKKLQYPYISTIGDYRIVLDCFGTGLYGRDYNPEDPSDRLCLDFTLFTFDHDLKSWTEIKYCGSNSTHITADSSPSVCQKASDYICRQYADVLKNNQEASLDVLCSNLSLLSATDFSNPNKDSEFLFNRITDYKIKELLCSHTDISLIPDIIDLPDEFFIQKVIFKSLDEIREDFDTIRQLWQEFGDVSYDPDKECIDVPWRGFEAGTSRYDIWHWFEERFDLPVAELLYNFDDCEESIRKYRKYKDIRLDKDKALMR